MSLDLASLDSVSLDLASLDSMSLDSVSLDFVSLDSVSLDLASLDSVSLDSVGRLCGVGVATEIPANNEAANYLPFVGHVKQRQYCALEASNVAL